jgi:hypothetical protein
VRGIEIIKDSFKIHTGDDLGLIQEVKEIGNPTPQSYLVEVPGRNGLVNLTKGLTGNVTYSNRSLRFQYLASGTYEEVEETIDLFNSLHGETFKIIDDDTPDYYYEGEATVTVTRKGILTTITLNLNANPFRERLALTNITTALTTADKTLAVNNYGVVVQPTIIVDNTAKIVYKGNTYTLSAGTYKISDVELKTGYNSFIVSGSGNLTIQYREAKI